MRLFSGNLAVFRDAISFLRKNRHLAFEVGKREFSDWHVGQAFGMGWGFGRQLSIMSLDVFVFGMVFKATIGDTVEMPLDYMTYLLSGLVA